MPLKQAIFRAFPTVTRSEAARSCPPAVRGRLRRWRSAIASRLSC